MTTKYNINLAWGVKDPQFICDAERKITLLNVPIEADTNKSWIILSAAYLELMKVLENEVISIDDLYLINWEKV